MPGVTKVYYGDYRNQTQSPAFCNRDTGELYINTPVYDRYNKNEKFYFLLHELGHLDLNTADELQADKYASDIYLSKGYPITDSIKALSQALKFNKPQDYQRLINQFNRDVDYDYYVNGNVKTKNMKIPNLINSADGNSLGNIISNIGTDINSIGKAVKLVDGTYVPGSENQQTKEKAVTKTEMSDTTKDNTWTYVFIVLILIVIMVLILMLKKKK